MYLCSCGNKKEIRESHVRSGDTTSCGCIKKQPKTHGNTGTPTYNSWLSAKGRCLNKNNTAYPDYGGRGITFCTSWQYSFENFLEDMGERPSANHSLDRIDNSKGYCKSNCRWATKKQQANNRRKRSGSTQYHGVTKRSDMNLVKFRATIVVNGKKVSCGTFTCPVEAAKAYNDNVIKLGLSKPLNKIL